MTQVKLNLFRQRYELSKLVRRSDKKIKDANLQAEEERRVGDQYKEQVTCILYSCNLGYQPDFLRFLSYHQTVNHKK